MEIVRSLILSLVVALGTAAAPGPATSGGGSQLNPDGSLDSAFDQAFHGRVLPLVESLGTFGGAHLDEQGVLVVSLTDAPDTVVQEIEDRLPNTGRGVVIRTAKYTEAEFLDAIPKVWDLAVALGMTLSEVGFDVYRNQLVVKVPPGSPTDELGQSLSSGLNLPFFFQESDMPQDAHCSTREHCHDPTRAGVRIYASPGGASCTMAFHVVKNGDAEFVTAGHCGYGDLYTWTHPATANLGAQDSATQFGPSGRDIMRVTMNNAQVTKVVYGGAIVGSARNPLAGEPICVSFGRSAALDCTANVNLASTSWTSSTCGCTVYGASTTGIIGIPGDSGSPIYANTGTSTKPAIGVLDTAGGNFAKLGDALSEWGWSIYTG